MTEQASLIVIGGGIVGLATAHAYATRHKGAEVVVLEKESRVGSHQTGRNSGVIHSGIYYRPGSLKARLCKAGAESMVRFCLDSGVPHEVCGKVIVATKPSELPRLERILERGQANGIECERIGPERLAELEPAARGVGAIRVPGAGIVDYAAMCDALADRLGSSGGRVECGARVDAIERSGAGVLVNTADGRSFTGERLITCAGLQADRVAVMSGDRPADSIIPFRGEYFELRPRARARVRSLIYPVPNPSFPFLGVHFTKMIEQDEHGHRVECGPNAVLAFAREGYRWTDVAPRDLAEALTNPAVWTIVRRYWRTGLGEMWRSASKGAFVRALRRLVPDIGMDDLVRAPAGVRAQALAPDGTLVDDFSMINGDGVVNVINAPSPAATASLAIANEIVERLDATDS